MYIMPGAMPDTPHDTAPDVALNGSEPAAQKDSIPSSNNSGNGETHLDLSQEKSIEPNPPAKRVRTPRKKKTNGQTGRKSISRKLADTLLQAFREEGPNFSAVARIAGCNRRYAKKAWEHGIVQYQMRAFKDVIASEQEEARLAVRKDWENQHRAEHWASRPDDAQDGIELAKRREEMAKDAIQARKEEAQMVRLLRNDVTNGLAAVARTLPGIQEWAKQANLKLLQSGPKDAKEAFKIMEQASRIMDRIGNAASQVMQMERRLLGQPEMIVGVAVPELSFEDALVHLRATDRTLARAEKLGLVPEGTTVGLAGERRDIVAMIDVADADPVPLDS